MLSSHAVMPNPTVVMSPSCYISRVAALTISFSPQTSSALGKLLLAGFLRVQGTTNSIDPMLLTWNYGTVSSGASARDIFGASIADGLPC